MEYPPPRFLIVCAWLNGSISTDEMIEMLELHEKQNDEKNDEKTHTG